MVPAPVRPLVARFLATAALAACAFPALAQKPAPIKAVVPATLKPAWSKGIQPISRDSYYHAIECGNRAPRSPRACSTTRTSARTTTSEDRKH